jgi:SAM-dependent methyltransferase
MEVFSDRFKQEYRQYFYDYLWEIDPLHHWSRLYEYPFVFNKISSFINNNKLANYRILDAGSGTTFFPYYISEFFENAMVFCCDLNPINKDIFNDINSYFQKKLLFDINDLRKTDYADCSFDIIYCISVLEHTRDYEKIINEFKRILKPSGLLIITFDICIEGGEDISPEEAQRFLKLLYTHFAYKPVENNIHFEDKLNSRDIMTSNYIKRINPSALPQESKISIISLLRFALKIFISDEKMQKVINFIKPGSRKRIREKLSFIKRPVTTNTTIYCGQFYKP